MKRASVIMLFVVMFVAPVFSQQSAEDVAKDILNAYKNKDVALLKKNASGMLKAAISDSYFQDKSILKDMKMVNSWDGKIRELRYEELAMPGKKILMCTAYYADAPEKDMLCVVLLSSMDNKSWVMFANGLSSIQKEAFEKLSKSGSFK